MNNIGIIGAGSMGEAIIKGLGEDRRFHIYIAEKNKKRLNHISRRYKSKKSTLEQLTKLCEIIIICVKPQDIDALLLSLGKMISRKNTLISIAAGVTTAYIEKNLKTKSAVVRVMPNLPGLMGKGVSGYCLGKNAGAKAGRNTEIIFKTLGKVFKIQENKMNAITAISGSGPGFVAYFTAALEEAAVDIGLNKEQARMLAVNATAGTGALLEKELNTPQELIKRVASKGGTTQAGLKVFEDAKLKAIVKNVAKAAAKRAKELNR